MSKSVMALVVLNLIAARSFAESDCSKPLNYKEVLACAEMRSPEVQNAELEVERAKAQIQSAAQWQNPELSAESVQGKSNNQNINETDLALSVPIELGGKISSRKAIAEGGVALSEAKLFEAKSKLRAQVFLKLHRLRQVLHEQQIAEEAIRTFSTLITQYAKRPGLSPEQQISSSVYQLSKSEYELRKLNAIDEILSLDTFFKTNVGMRSEDLKGVTPTAPKNWPKYEVAAASRLSPQQKVLQADIDTAKAELSLAQAEAWPTLKIGPSMKMQTEGSQSNNLVGLNVSLPIPVLNTNSGAKAAAQAAIRSRETQFSLGHQEQVNRREELLKVYDQSVRMLKESVSHEEIEKKHADAERLFSKGVVPSALIIEAHRTSFELEKARHERELKAFETLLDLYFIDGTSLEANL